ncbi:hypothetical protein D3C87_1703320 [compost metagenome]
MGQSCLPQSLAPQRYARQLPQVWLTKKLLTCARIVNPLMEGLAGMYGTASPELGHVWIWDTFSHSWMVKAGLEVSRLGRHWPGCKCCTHRLELRGAASMLTSTGSKVSHPRQSSSVVYVRTGQAFIFWYRFRYFLSMVLSCWL